MQDTVKTFRKFFKDNQDGTIDQETFFKAILMEFTKYRVKSFRIARIAQILLSHIRLMMDEAGIWDPSTFIDMVGYILQDDYAFDGLVHLDKGDGVDVSESLTGVTSNFGDDSQTFNLLHMFEIAPDEKESN